METPDKNKNLEFSRLVRDVKACTKCARMRKSERVIGLACGSLSAKIMFVGEAPGRLGADMSNIPFHGDQAGHNFESLIEGAGISRYESFVTNAVLCNPKDDKGNNGTPTSEEISNCAGFLKRQIDLVQPEIVVTLGGTALKATSKVAFHNWNLSDSVRVARDWYQRKLIPVYHPGQRAMIHRSFANQLVDYQFIANTLLHKHRSQASISSRKISRPKAVALIGAILSALPRLTYFSLHKLFFLIEHEALIKLGHRITDCYIIRQKDGPYCVDLHIGKLRKTFPELVSEYKGNKLYVAKSGGDLFSNDGSRIDLEKIEIDLVNAVMSRYGSMSDAELKKCAYITSEMREVLRIERRLGSAMMNLPLLDERRRGKLIDAPVSNDENKHSLSV